MSSSRFSHSNCGRQSAAQYGLFEMRAKTIDDPLNMVALHPFGDPRIVDDFSAETVPIDAREHGRERFGRSRVLSAPGGVPMLRRAVSAVEQRTLPRTERRGTRRRPLQDRFALRFPSLATRINARLTTVILRLPRSWRLRRLFIEVGTRRAFNAVGRGDLEVIRTVNHPDVVWELSRWEWPEQSLYRGRDGIVRFTGLWIDQWSDLDFDVVSVEELEHRRVFLVHLRGRGIGRASGVEAEQDMFKVVQMRGGLVWRGTFFRDRATAIEAARAGDL
jgi:ketosteroid isomerase-like protein